MSDVFAITGRPNYTPDAGVSFDNEGYAVTMGDDGPDHIKKAANDDTFLGVNHHDSYDVGSNAPLLAGEETGGVAVTQAGTPNVLCKDGVNYTPGTAIYLSDVPGVCDSVVDSDANATDDTRVGTVVKQKDSSAGDGTGTVLVPVNITGRV